MFGAGRGDNIEQLTRVCDSFDGIVATYHFPEDNGYDVLMHRKKAGRILRMEYIARHDHSMNYWLHSGHISPGDYCVLRDDSERLNENFCSKILRQEIIPFMEAYNIAALYQRSKVLIFKMSYDAKFVGTPHFGLNDLGGYHTSMDNLPEFQNDKDYAWSVRDEQRPPEHRLYHEMKYCTFPTTNHLALFHPNPEDFNNSEKRRRYLREYCLSKGIEFSVEGFKTYLDSNDLDQTMKDIFNYERPFRNFYRWYKLKHTPEQILQDENKWRIP